MNLYIHSLRTLAPRIVWPHRVDPQSGTNRYSERCNGSEDQRLSGCNDVSLHSSLFPFETRLCFEENFERQTLLRHVLNTEIVLCVCESALPYHLPSSEYVDDANVGQD